MEKFILWCINHGLDVIVEHDVFQNNIHLIIFRKKDSDPDWRIGKVPRHFEAHITPMMGNDSFHACIDMWRFKELDEESKSNIFDEFTRRTKEYFKVKE